MSRKHGTAARPFTSPPVCTEKSRGAIANFWIFQLLFWQTFLTVSDSLRPMGSGSLASQAYSDNEYHQAQRMPLLFYKILQYPRTTQSLQTQAGGSAACQHRLNTGVG